MKYQLTIEIDKPREQVVELFSNPENLAFWQPGYLGMEHVSGEEGKAGAVYLLKFTHGRSSKVMEMTETVEVDNLPEEFTARYDAKGMKMRVANRFEEAGPEKTRLFNDSEAEVSGIFMRLMTILMPGCFKRQSMIYLENFKAFAETGADCRKKK